MSTLQMPKVDNAIMSKKDKIASDLRGIINSKNVLSNPDELRPFETDGLTRFPGLVEGTVPERRRSLLKTDGRRTSRSAGSVVGRERCRGTASAGHRSVTGSWTTG
jgi:hypothetical protein